MSKVLIINEAELKERSVIEHNVDGKQLSKVIYNVQEVQLRECLGKDLYDFVLTDILNVATFPDNATLTDKTTGLLNYIKPFLIYATLAEWIELNNYKLTNKGVLKLNDQSASAANSTEIENARHYYANYASSYKKRLVDYMRLNGLITRYTETGIQAQPTGWFINNEPRNLLGNGYGFGKYYEDYTYNVASNPEASIDNPSGDGGSGSNEVSIPVYVKWPNVTEKPDTFPADWNSIINIPTSFPPSAHTHAIADVTGLQAILDGKQAVGSYVTTDRTLTINGVTSDFTQNLSFTIDTHWAAILGKPTFATVATSGLYSDLAGLPVLFSGSYTDLTNKPSIPTDNSQIANGRGYITSAALTWANVTGKPVFSTVATSGSYTDLLNKPVLATVATTGSYTDLLNKPTIPTDNSQLANGAGFITASALSQPANQIVYGTGTGVTSNAGMTFNSSVNRLFLGTGANQLVFSPGSATGGGMYSFATTAGDHYVGVTGGGQKLTLATYASGIKITDTDISFLAGTASGGANIRMTSNGLMIGTLTDNGNKLQVNGGSTFTGAVTVDLSNGASASKAFSLTALSLFSGSYLQATFQTDGYTTLEGRNSNTASASGVGLQLSALGYGTAQYGLMDFYAAKTDSTTIAAATRIFNFRSSAGGNHITVYGLGEVALAGSTRSGALLTSNGSITASGTIARGNYFANTLTAAANNDTLVAVDIQPTFTNGAFTGVNDIALRTGNGSVVIGASTTAGTEKLNVGGQIRSFIAGAPGSTSPNLLLYATSSSYYSGFSTFNDQNDVGQIFNTGSTYNIISGVSARGFGIYHTGTGGMSFVSDAGVSSVIKFVVGGAASTNEVVRFTSNGLLIGTTTDAGYKLQVNGNILANNLYYNATTALVNSLSSGVAVWQAKANTSGASFQTMNTLATGFSGIEYLNNAGAATVFTGYNNGNQGEFRFNNIATSGYIDFMINSVSALRITNNKNILMGPTGDFNTYKLDLSASSSQNGARFSINDATGNFFNFILYNSNAGTGALTYFSLTDTNGNTGAIIGASTANATYGIANGITIGAGKATQDIGFRVGSAIAGGGNCAMFIKANGNVLMGTATDTGQRLQVTGDIKVTGKANIGSLPTYADNASATTGGLVAGDLYKTSTGQVMVRF